MMQLTQKHWRSTLIFVAGALFTLLLNKSCDWLEKRQKKITAEQDVFSRDNSLFNQITYDLCIKVIQNSLCPLQIKKTEPSIIENLPNNSKRWADDFFSKVDEYDKICNNIDLERQKIYVLYFYFSAKNTSYKALMSIPDIFHPDKSFKQMADECEELRRTTETKPAPID